MGMVLRPEGGARSGALFLSVVMAVVYCATTHLHGLGHVLQGQFAATNVREPIPAAKEQMAGKRPYQLHQTHYSQDQLI